MSDGANPAGARAHLYQRIAGTLRASIETGASPLGSALPGEEELCRRYGASRYTVRAALAMLEDEGLILRRTGTRATVIARRPREAFVQSIGDIDQMLNYPEGTQRRNLDSCFVEADRELAAQLGCETGRSWFRIRALRVSYAHRHPLAFVEIFLLPEFAAVAKRRDHESAHVYQQVERQFGVSIRRARIEMSAARVAPDLAAALEVEPGSPALVVLRRYSDANGRIFEATRTWHAEGRYVFSMELERRLPL